MAGPWSPEQRARHAATVAAKRSLAVTQPVYGQRCDICGVSGADALVLHFGLIYRRPGRQPRGVGAVELCSACWQRGPARRRRRAGATRTSEPSNARSVRETTPGAGLSMAPGSQG